MNTHPTPRSHGYWYGAGRARADAVQVLDALREYRTAETAMRRRAKDSMGMGETDLLALRHMLAAARAGRPLSPRDLAVRLGISSASTTTLLDRLTRSGHVRRSPHPTDRRALVVTATEHADAELRATLGGVHRRMLEAAERLTPEQAGAVVDFLHAVRDAVDGTDLAPEHTRPEGGEGSRPERDEEPHPGTDEAARRDEGGNDRYGEDGNGRHEEGGDGPGGPAPS